jgi:G2/mitotic-specific cyclin-B, other
MMQSQNYFDAENANTLAGSNKPQASHAAANKPQQRTTRSTRRALGSVTGNQQQAAPQPGKAGVAKPQARRQAPAVFVAPQPVQQQQQQQQQQQPLQQMAPPQSFSAFGSAMEVEPEGQTPELLDLSLYEEDADVKNASSSDEFYMPPRTIDPIDYDVADDELYVAEYALDIMQYMKETEMKRLANPQYMDKQNDINGRMREILIDWLIEVHLKFKLRQETLFLAVNLIDRFLERKVVSRTKLQLIGCTALLLASKYEEIWAPEVRDFEYISDEACKCAHILKMETIMLSTLQFNLTACSSFRFAERYAKIARGDKKFNFLVTYLCEMTLQESSMLKYRPSVVAASAVYLARRLSKFTGEHWDADLVRLTGYSHSDIMPCARAMYSIATKDKPKYKAVRRKYSHEKFMSVACLITPSTSSSSGSQ